MSQTITFKNPTGESVAYQSRECRLTVPASDSITLPLSDDVATRVLAHFKRHHPLISTSVVEPEEAEVVAEAEKAPAKAKAKATPAKAAPEKAAGTTDEGSNEAAK